MAGSLSVLLVEDDILIRDLYRETLVRAGYKVEVAGDATETYLKLKSFHADVIMLDIILPGESGITILQRLRKQKELDDTHIIMVTNLAQASLAKEAMANRADGYVIKAEIQPKDLIRIIEELEA